MSHRVQVVGIPVNFQLTGNAGIILVRQIYYIERVDDSEGNQISAVTDKPGCIELFPGLANSIDGIDCL